MTLYHAISSYQLLFCMVHKEKSGVDFAVLVVTDTLIQSYPDIQSLEEIFGQVIVYPIALTFDSQTQDKAIVDYFDSMLLNNGINIDRIDLVYVAAAHYYFSVYLILKKHYFMMIEDAAGILSRPHILEEIELKIGNYIKNRRENAYRYQLYTGNNAFITQKICNISAQKKGFYDEKAINFNLMENLTLLDDKSRQRLLKFFKVESIDVPEQSVLLFTQHFSNLCLLTKEQQEEMYQYFTDYFWEGYQVIIKKHPNDLVEYNKLIHNAMIIPSNYPAELIPFVFFKLPRAVSTIYSTSVNNLKGYFRESVVLDEVFHKHYQSIHKYMACVHLLTSFSNTIKTVQLMGCDSILIKALLKRHMPDHELECLEYSLDNHVSDILVVDDSLYEVDYNEIYYGIASNYKVVIYLNTSRKFSEFIEEVKNRELEYTCYEVNVQNEDNLNSNLSDDLSYIYVLFNDQKIRQYMNFVSYTQNLVSAKLRICCKKAEDSLQFMILKDKNILLMQKFEFLSEQLGSLEKENQSLCENLTDTKGKMTLLKKELQDTQQNWEHEKKSVIELNDNILTLKQDYEIKMNNLTDQYTNEKNRTRELETDLNEIMARKSWKVIQRLDKIILHFKGLYRRADRK